MRKSTNKRISHVKLSRGFGDIWWLEHQTNVHRQSLFRVFGEPTVAAKEQRVAESVDPQIFIIWWCWTALPFPRGRSSKVTQNRWSWTGESGSVPLPVTWTWRAGKCSMSWGRVQSFRAPRTCFNSHVKLKCLATCWIYALIFVHWTSVRLWTVPNKNIFLCKYGSKACLSD